MVVKVRVGLGVMFKYMSAEASSKNERETVSKEFDKFRW